MKRISLLMIALIAVFSFSCGLLDKADVSFNATLPLEFKAINETATSSSPKNYTDTQVLDASQNADVAKYKDKIKEFKVNKVYYEITESTVGSGTTISNSTLAYSGKTIASKASATSAVTAKTELTDLNVDGINALAATLKADQKASVTLNSTFAKTPVAFKVKAYFDVTITASALK